MSSRSRILLRPFRCRFGAALLAGIAASACSCSPVWASKDTVPDWVRTAAQQPLTKVSPTAKAVVLLDDTTYTVATDGRAVQRVRRVIKILRPQGRSRAEPEVWYDKDSKVIEMHVWSIDPAGHEYALKDKDIADIGTPIEGGELYSDDRARVASPPGRDPGGIVAFEYTRQERPYIAEASWFFQDDLPRLHESFTLELPAGYRYTTTWAHHDAIATIDLEHQHYRWERTDEPAIELERVPLAPSFSSLAARMTVHWSGPGMAQPQEGTWKGIGQWYAELERGRLQPNPEIAGKAASLTAGKSDFYDRAESIAEWVQKEVRYFGVELGIGGYQPHSAAEIYKSRYGDCKDKATLLTAMLASADIHAALLMVHTRRGVIDPRNPSIIGNHMIAAIEVPAGYNSPKLRSVVTAATGKRYLIFDPTWRQTPFGQLESNLQGGYGVLLEGDESQVIQLPVLSPELNRIHRSGVFDLAADGTLRGKVTEARFGDLSEGRRELFTHANSREQQETLDRVISSDLQSATVSGLAFTNAEALNKELETSFRLDVPHFASAVGPLLMVRPRVLGRDDLPVDHERRLVPVDLDDTRELSDDFEIALPPGYSIDELPPPIKKDFDFATYESRTEMHEGKLRFTRRFVQKQVTLPADRYGDLLQLAGLIANDENQQAVLKKQQ